MSKEKFIRLDVKETFDYASGKTKPYYSIIYGDEDGEHRVGYWKHISEIASIMKKRRTWEHTYQRAVVR